ncbi:hypothetical protein V6U84_62385, partial [Micromonospora sp. CPCC 205714]
GGASAVQLLVEIADVAATTTWVTRRPPVFRDGPFTPDYGREVVAQVEARVRAGLPPGSIASATELSWTPQLLEARERGLLRRRPMFDRIVPGGVQWRDGAAQDVDVILWCTGFRPALDDSAPLRLRGPRGRHRRGRHPGGRRSPDPPGRLRAVCEHGRREPGRAGSRPRAARAAGGARPGLTARRRWHPRKISHIGALAA